MFLFLLRFEVDDESEAEPKRELEPEPELAELELVYPLSEMEALSETEMGNQVASLLLSVLPLLLL